MAASPRFMFLLVCVILLTAIAEAGYGDPPPKKSPPPPPPKKSPPPPPPKKSPPPPPPKSSPPPKQPNPEWKSCNKKSQFPFCIQKMLCPPSCPKSCQIDCKRCVPVCPCNKPGGVCHDPQFVGGDGITFYFHGRKNRDFCLLSDSNLHINAHFIGRRNPMMRRDFTWVQSIAILFGSHKLYVGAQKTAVWDNAVDRLAIAFDGEPVVLPAEDGAKWQSSIAPAVTIVRPSDTNEVMVEINGLLKITAGVVPITAEDSRIHNYGLTADDSLAHLELGFKFYSLTSDVEGVLGQTYRDDYVSRVKLSANMPVLGGADKYSTSNLYAADCAAARFGRGGAGLIAMSKEFADISCQSNMSGRGIVCKK